MMQRALHRNVTVWVSILGLSSFPARYLGASTRNRGIRRMVESKVIFDPDVCYYQMKKPYLFPIALFLNL